MLPIDYRIRMKDLLGDEYDDFLRSMEAPEYKALRLNPLKVDRAQFLAFINDIERGSLGDVIIERDPVPWEGCGFYYSIADGAGDEGARIKGPGLSPFHEAGAYYIQEPSAMKPVSLMDIQPGERVLDMCAAPGGKSTQISAYLGGKGLLAANEYVPSRANILSSNIERMGIRNALVLNEKPAKIGSTFASFFDKILVDAPCSGEGMFRKNEQALKEWSIDNVMMCADRQDEILSAAANALRPGGTLVYSTCTFSREEDEDCIERFLNTHADYTMIGMEKLFPHRIKGEGHFVAKLVRNGDASPIVRLSEDAASSKKNRGKSGRDEKAELFRAFCDDLLSDETAAGLREDKERLLSFGDNLYLRPEGIGALSGLKVIRPGLHLATYIKNRFEPAHALAMALKPGEVRRVVDITYEEARSYLAGLTLNASGENGWCLVCLNGISLGWGKLVNGTLKNHYPKGLRRTI